MNFKRLIEYCDNADDDAYAILGSIKSIQNRMEHYLEHPDCCLEYHKTTIREDLNEIEHHMENLNTWYNELREQVKYKL